MFLVSSPGVALALAATVLALLPVHLMAANTEVEPEITPMPASNTPTPDPLSVDELVAAQQQFGFDLLGQLMAAEPEGNLFFSPFSIAMALQMTQSGAQGSTFEAMSEVFHLPPLTADGLAAGNGTLLQALRTDLDPEVNLAIANSLWVRQGIPLNSAFLQRSLDAFDADVNQLDFGSATAPGQINGWVEQQTQGQIDEIVGTIDPDTLLYLINAIYFKGSWTQAFDPDLTDDQPFTHPDGSQSSVPLMRQTGRMDYIEQDGVQWVSLPYGENQDLSFVLGVPQVGIPLSEVLSELDGEQWQQTLDQLSLRAGTVFLPRFELSSETDLVAPLSDLGMEIAFGDQANFGGITTIPVRISQVTHKAVLTVNEEGSEAAAATAVGVVTRSAPREDSPFVVRADRPFVATIQDNRTGAILFMAVVQDPSR